MKKSTIIAAASLVALLSSPSAAQQTDPPPSGEVGNFELAPDVVSKWGALALLAGSYWSFQFEGSEDSTLMEYTWIEPGRILEVKMNGTSSRWELNKKGRLVFRDASGKDTKEKWIVAEDGSVSRKKKGIGGDYILTLRSAGPDRIEFISRKVDRPLTAGSTGAYVRLSQEEAALAQAMKLQIQDGIFDAEGGAFVVLSQQGDTLTSKKPTISYDFKRQANAEFHFRDPKNPATWVFRIIDPITVEWSVLQDDYSQQVILKRRNGRGVQPPELEAGTFGLPDAHPSQTTTFKLEGEYLVQATSYGVQHYRRGPDGLYRSELYDGVVQVVDPYTIEFIPRNGAPTHKIVRRGNSSPTAFADAQRAENEAERQWRIEEAQMAAEDARLARLEQQYAAENPPEVTTNNMGGFLGGFMKGLTEATASNNAMEQSMRDAANAGLASGAAQYPGQSSYGSSAGITIEERPEEDYVAPSANTGGTQMQFYAWCFAMESPKIIFSPIQAITVETPWSTGPMANAFGASVGSRNATCQTEKDQATAEARMDDMIAAWPQRTPVHTQVRLIP